MADNLDITAGSGTSIATDQVGSDHYQRIKLSDGTADSSTHLGVFSEDVATPATITGLTGMMERDDALSSLTPIEGDWAAFRCSAEGALWTQDFNSDAIKTALELIDNAVDGNYLNTNMNLAGTDVTAGAGAVAAGTPRVTLASDDPGVALLTTIDADTGAIKTAVELIDNAISGSEMQVDIVADGAGLATDAKLDTIITALQIMDDWDDSDYCNVNLNLAGTDVTGGAGAVAAGTPRVTLASDDPAVVDLAAMEVLLGTIDADTSNLGDIETNTDFGAVVGGGAEATALHVTIANDSTGVVSVDDGGGALTVDGTVTANLSATDNAVLDNIDTDTSAIQTAVEIMDDWDDGSDRCRIVGAAAEDAAVAGNPVLSGGRYDTTARELDNGDVGAIALSVDGGIVPGRHPVAWSATINSADATSATQVKAAGGAGKRYYVTSCMISVDTAMNVQIQDDAGTPNVMCENIYLAANGGFVLPIPPGSAIAMGADNQDIDVIASTAGNITVFMTGYTI